METPSTSRNGTKLCANIKQVRHDKINKETIRKIFQRYCKEIVVAMLNVKLLPDIIHTNCFGCTHDRPSQSEHECMMRDKEESVGMYFDEIMKKVDFLLVNHLALQPLAEKHPEEEIWEAILNFNTDVESYLKDKRWCRQIKHRLIALD